MHAFAWVVVVVAVMAVAAAVGWVVSRNRRRTALRARFGPEYDRTVAAAADRRAAERHLADLAHARDTIDLRDLDPVERARLDERWEAVQSRFVDEPGAAVADADTLVTLVMRERGYPVDDTADPPDGTAGPSARDAQDDRAALLATDHEPDVVDRYRRARAAHDRHRASGAADTEDLRQAFVGYRALYEALTGSAVTAGAAHHGRHVREDAPEQ